MTSGNTEHANSYKHRADNIRNYIRARTPGLLDMLDTQSIHTYGKDVLTLLLESPCKVYNMINSISRDENTTKCVLTYVLLRPLSNLLDQKTQQEIYSNMGKCMNTNVQT